GVPQLERAGVEPLDDLHAGHRPGAGTGVPPRTHTLPGGCLRGSDGQSGIAHAEPGTRGRDLVAGALPGGRLAQVEGPVQPLLVCGAPRLGCPLPLDAGRRGVGVPGEVRPGRQGFRSLSQDVLVRRPPAFHGLMAGPTAGVVGGLTWLGRRRHLSTVTRGPACPSGANAHPRSLPWPKPPPPSKAHRMSSTSPPTRSGRHAGGSVSRFDPATTALLGAVLAVVVFVGI